MVKRQIEVWKRIEVLEYPTESKWIKDLVKLKRKFRKKEGYKCNGVKIKTPKTDEFLTGIDKQVFHNKEELPKLTKEERLKRFKNDRII